MNSEVLTKLTKARIALIFEQPFFGQLALRLALKEMSPAHEAMFAAHGMIPTLAVDGKTIYYSPSFIQGLSHELTKSALAHEIGHCIYDHTGRRGAREPMRWNFAGDYVINDMLKDANFEIGKGWLLDAQYKGMSSDEIYNRLPTEEDGQSQGGGGFDIVMDAEAGEAEVEALEWKIAVSQAAQTAKAAGKLPASLERFLEEMQAPKVDWRAQLRQFVTQLSKNDYTWMRPNRRFLSAGFFMPSLFSENMGTIAVAIDTSGSIDAKTLTAFGAEIKAIKDSVNPEKIVIIYCDARVNHIDTFEQYDELHFDMHGGGGTDFRPPFEYLKEHEINPACFVYLTDGYGPFGESTTFPTLWCMTTEVKAPFGENIRIEV